MKKRKTKETHETNKNKLRIAHEKATLPKQNTHTIILKKDNKWTYYVFKQSEKHKTNIWNGIMKQLEHTRKNQKNMTHTRNNNGNTQNQTKNAETTHQTTLTIQKHKTT